MRHALLAISILAMPFAVAVGAATPELGKHVSSIAPEHPRTSGADFGECVMEMAITGDCPHLQ